jgi:hypothetical protein
VDCGRVTAEGDHHVELTRRVLVGFLRQQAEWRLWKAEECPSERRNAHCAERLLDLAELVDLLPIEDERLAMLAMVHHADADVLSPGEEAAGLAGGYCFERDENPGTWLRRFVESAVAATLEGIEDESRWL